MIIKQGNREFVTWTTPTGMQVAYVHSVNGKPYTGKGYAYHPCPICGTFVCHMMGGSERHIKMCESKNAPEFYYEWGDEPIGKVSTGTYMNEVFKNTGFRPKNEVKHLPYHNPHS